MVTSARHSAEDAAEDAFVAIRRHPFTAVALAATAGVALGAAAVGVASVIHRLKAGGSCD